MAAKKILTPFDFSRNEIQNAVLHVLAAAPSSPVPGQVYYNSTSGRLEFRGASAWIDPTARANHTGTQAWSTLTGTPTTLAGYGITDAQPADADLTAVAALSANGLIARTGAGTAAVRSLASATAAATWSNADGAAGNPSLTIANVVAGGNAGLMTGADKTKLDGIAAGATANATDAQLRDRATHTGTQLAATISNFDTQVRTSRLDQMAAPTAAVSMNSQELTNVANATSNSSAPNLGQVQTLIDNARAGLSVKDPVRVAAQANVNLTAPGATIDGVTMAVGNRFLAPVQTTVNDRGIYVWNGAAVAATRATDADGTGEVFDGSIVAVADGTDAGRQYIQRATPTGAIGTWAQDWTVYSTGGTSYTAGNGLTLTGADFNVGAGTGITVTADAVAIDTAVVARKTTGLIGNGSLTQIDFAHNLGNQWVTCQLFEVATLAQVEADIVLLNANTVRLIFSVAPATNAIRVVVTG